MKTVTLIIGLPGSGKTHLGKELASKTDAVLLDDPKDKERLLPLLAQNEYNIIICDPWLCFEKTRKYCVETLKLMDRDVVINYIYFENDLPSCQINLQRRKDEGDARLIDKDLQMFHLGYRVPLEVKPQAVWRENA